MKSLWHVWVVGIFTLIWNGMGAMDYVLTVSRNANYIAHLATNAAWNIAYRNRRRPPPIAGFPRGVPLS